MSKKAQTGSVKAKGKITAKRINTGVQIAGNASDETIKTALDALTHLHAGDVTSEAEINVTEMMNVGILLELDRPQFVEKLSELRTLVAEAAQEGDASPEVVGAVDSIDDALAEAQKETPLGKKIVNRLQESLEFISTAGKALDSASKAGVLIAKAIPVAAGLYQIAQTLF